MCSVLLPPGDNRIAVNKYISDVAAYAATSLINITTYSQF